MKIGVLLSGNGVYDGAEIHEAVLTMLAIEEMGWESVCISIDRLQHHVINHITGEPMEESRNMLLEAARIARGNIQNITEIQPADIDALVIPGGFGSAKNFSTWAFEGPAGSILPEVKLLLVNLVNVGKPIVALCVSPVLIALAFQGSGIQVHLSLGSTQERSPYDISAFNSGINQTGAITEEKTIREVLVDAQNRIVCAPCYMMNATLSEVRANIVQAMQALNDLL
jgi:enhancing lycopene biosynthesis protein 2